MPAHSTIPTPDLATLPLEVLHIIFGNLLANLNKQQHKKVEAVLRLVNRRFNQAILSRKKSLYGRMNYFFDWQDTQLKKLNTEIFIFNRENTVTLLNQPQARFTFERYKYHMLLVCAIALAATMIYPKWVQNNALHSFLDLHKNHKYKHRLEKTIQRHNWGIFLAVLILTTQIASYLCSAYFSNQRYHQARLSATARAALQQLENKQSFFFSSNNLPHQKLPLNTSLQNLKTELNNSKDELNRSANELAQFFNGYRSSPANSISANEVPEHLRFFACESVKAWAKEKSVESFIQATEIPTDNSKNGIK